MLHFPSSLDWERWDLYKQTKGRKEEEKAESSQAVPADVFAKYFETSSPHKSQLQPLCKNPAIQHTWVPDFQWTLQELEAKVAPRLISKSFTFIKMFFSHHYKCCSVKMLNSHKIRNFSWCSSSVSGGEAHSPGVGCLHHDCWMKSGELCAAEQTRNHHFCFSISLVGVFITGLLCCSPSILVSVYLLLLNGANQLDGMLENMQKDVNPFSLL